MSCGCAEGHGGIPKERLSVRLAVGEEPQGRRLGLVGVAGAAGAPALKRSQMSARARLGRGGGGGGGGGGGRRASKARTRPTCFIALAATCHCVLPSSLQRSPG